MARILLCPAGSHGDVHPFVGLGVALKARGHDVHLLTAEPFRHLAERHGFEFAPVGTSEDYHAVTHHPDLWHPSRSMKVIYGNRGWINRLLRDGHKHVADRYEPGNTVAAAGVLAMGARVARDALGVPLATLHLQPIGLVSVEKPPVFAAARMRTWWPRWFRRLAYWYGDRGVIDPMLLPTLNGFRAELGLPPVRRVFGKWVNSPDRVINLFPAWFGTAPDWPPQTVQTGFVRYDQAETPPPPAVEAFLNAGDPPVVFTFGSAMRNGAAYFAAAADACRRLNVRGLLLCHGAGQVPANLPPGVLHADYAPFSAVFPRAAAVVHHGGIGTSAQALAAGVPQLVMPLAFDQPDNADRLERLGVARWLWPKRFTGANVAAELKALLAAGDAREAARTVAGRMADGDAAAETCGHLEALVGTERSRPAV